MGLMGVNAQFSPLPLVPLPLFDSGAVISERFSELEEHRRALQHRPGGN